MTRTGYDEMTIRDLIAAGEPDPVPPTGLDALLAAMEAEPMATTPVEITIGDVSTTVTFTEIRGFEWSHIATNPPRVGHMGDAQLGCHTEHVLRNYPLDRIECAGVHPSADEWHRLCSLIDADARTDIVVALWWMHVEQYRLGRAALLSMPAALAAKSKGEAHE